MIEATPLRRLPRMEELASVVVFLVSDESSYIQPRPRGRPPGRGRRVVWASSIAV